MIRKPDLAPRQQLAALLVVAASLGSSRFAVAQAADPNAQHTRGSAPTSPTSSPHAGHGMSQMSSMQAGAGGMEGMAGMTMSGMSPPTPRQSPPGPVLLLSAAGQSGASPSVAGSPGQLTLTFERPVQLEEVRLTNRVGQQIPSYDTMLDAPVIQFVVYAPLRLAAGDYRLAWRSSAAGQDHTGQTAFSILPADGTAIPEMSAQNHHH